MLRIATSLKFRMKLIAFLLISLAVIFGAFLALGLIAQIVMSFAKIRLRHLIAALVTGGIGYAVGNLASSGWAVFGAILGALIGVAAASQ